MNNLIEDLDELLELIKQSDEYKEYIKFKDLVSINKDIKRLTDEIKKLQKEAVKLEHSNKSFECIEEEIKEKNLELNNIPLYNNYIDSVDRLNNLLLIVKKRFDSFISEFILRW